MQHVTDDCFAWFLLPLVYQDHGNPREIAMRQIVGNPTNSDVKKSALPNIEEHWKQEWELWYLMTSGAGYYGREAKPVPDWALGKAGRP